MQTTESMLNSVNPTSEYLFIPQPFVASRFATFCGVLDDFLDTISVQFDVQLLPRKEGLLVRGDISGAMPDFLQSVYDSAESLTLQSLSDQIADFRKMCLMSSRTGVSLTLTGQKKPTPEGKPSKSFTLEDRRPALFVGDSFSSPVLITRRADLKARSPNQQHYLQTIPKYVLSFGVGAAGTGKTYLAVACAVDALERGLFKRLVLTRPAVEAGESLGFLPGDLTQKIDPYLKPLFDALHDLLGVDKTQRFIEKQIIEIAPLAYMRGRTLSQAFVILDEAQNTTQQQMKMFLTRIGYGSKVVITGDLTQIDLPAKQGSGLVQTLEVLKSLIQKDAVGITFFESKDVVRHPLVGQIIDAYDQWEAAEKS